MERNDGSPPARGDSGACSPTVIADKFARDERTSSLKSDLDAEKRPGSSGRPWTTQLRNPHIEIIRQISGRTNEGDISDAESNRDSLTLSSRRTHSLSTWSSITPLSSETRTSTYQSSVSDMSHRSLNLFRRFTSNAQENSASIQATRPVPGPVRDGAAEVGSNSVRKSSTSSTGKRRSLDPGLNVLVSTTTSEDIVVATDILRAGERQEQELPKFQLLPRAALASTFTMSAAVIPYLVKTAPDWEEVIKRQISKPLAGLEKCIGARLQQDTRSDPDNDLSYRDQSFQNPQEAREHKVTLQTDNLFLGPLTGPKPSHSLSALPESSLATGSGDIADDVNEIATRVSDCAMNKRRRIQDHILTGVGQGLAEDSFDPKFSDSSLVLEPTTSYATENDLPEPESSSQGGSALTGQIAGSSTPASNADIDADILGSARFTVRRSSTLPVRFIMATPTLNRPPENTPAVSFLESDDDISTSEAYRRHPRKQTTMKSLPRKLLQHPNPSKIWGHHVQDAFPRSSSMIDLNRLPETRRLSPRPFVESSRKPMAPERSSLLKNEQFMPKPDDPDSLLDSPRYVARPEQREEPRTIPKVQSESLSPASILQSETSKDYTEPKRPPLSLNSREASLSLDDPNFLLPQHSATPENWRELRALLDTQFRGMFFANDVWNLNVWKFDKTLLHTIPLWIANRPVVFPYVPLYPIFRDYPSDPLDANKLTPSQPLTGEEIGKLFETFPKAMSASVLLNGTLVLNYHNKADQAADTAWAPLNFGGLKVDSIVSKAIPTCRFPFRRKPKSIVNDTQSLPLGPRKLDLTESQDSGAAVRQVIERLPPVPRAPKITIVLRSNSRGNQQTLAGRWTVTFYCDRKSTHQTALVGLHLIKPGNQLQKIRSQHALTITSHAILNALRFVNSNATVSDIEGIEIYNPQHAQKIGIVGRCYDKHGVLMPFDFDHDLSLLIPDIGMERFFPIPIFKVKGHPKLLEWLDRDWSKLSDKEKKSLVLLGGPPTDVSNNSPTSGETFKGKIVVCPGEMTSTPETTADTTETRTDRVPSEGSSQAISSYSNSATPEDELAIVETPVLAVGYVYRKSEPPYMRSLLWRPGHPRQFLPDGKRCPNTGSKCPDLRGCSGSPLVIRSGKRYLVVGFQNSFMPGSDEYDGDEDPKQLYEPIRDWQYSYYSACPLPSNLVKDYYIDNDTNGKVANIEGDQPEHVSAAVFVVAGTGSEADLKRGEDAQGERISTPGNTRRPTAVEGRVSGETPSHKISNDSAPVSDVPIAVANKIAKSKRLAYRAHHRHQHQNSSRPSSSSNVNEMSTGI